MNNVKIAYVLPLKQRYQVIKNIDLSGRGDDPEPSKVNMKPTNKPLK